MTKCPGTFIDKTRLELREAVGDTTKIEINLAGCGAAKGIIGAVEIANKDHPVPLLEIYIVF